MFILITFLLFFGGMVFLAIQSSRQDIDKKRQIAQSLGFSPVEADSKLTNQIAILYRRPGAQTRYELRNVSRRVIPDGEMYLFDLVDTSGEDDSWTERQAVAIISPHLNMPPLNLFPKADQKYAISGLANKVLVWGMSFMGTHIDFPEYPEFASRYIVSSNEATDWVRGYFDQHLAGYFSRTKMFMIHAAGNIFTFSEMGTKLGDRDPSVISQRVNNALDIFRARKNKIVQGVNS
ncbi:MAG: hypothetical protein HY865_19470 [Chloroflexi bacterium]|nr:hypothetical protein [Chloroflexota bacterium]